LSPSTARLRGGNVDDDVALPEGEIERGQPVERCGELAQPLLHRHVERRERLRTDAAGLGQAVAGLEALHRRFERCVIDLAVGMVRRQVLGHDQPLAQREDIGPG
jgi:hypothetical protein